MVVRAPPAAAGTVICPIAIAIASTGRSGALSRAGANAATLAILPDWR